MARYCKYCGNSGHNIRTCPSLKEKREKDPNSWEIKYVYRDPKTYSKKSCSYCSEEGHTRPTCPVLPKDQEHLRKINSVWRKRMIEYIVSIGATPGSLVTANPFWDETPSLGFIENFNLHAWSFEYSDSSSQRLFRIRFQTAPNTDRVADSGRIMNPQNADGTPDKFYVGGYTQEQIENMKHPNKADILKILSSSNMTYDEVLSMFPKDFLSSKDIVLSSMTMKNSRRYNAAEKPADRSHVRSKYYTKTLFDGFPDYDAKIDPE